MKILQTKTAPNPRRVRIFLAEKGIEVPYEELDLMQGALKTQEFTKLNRFQRVPVLILDDGTAIAETMAICRYFEETKPEPALFGKGAKQRALIEMWNRRMELGLLFSVAQAFRHLHPAAAPLEVPQVAAWGEANKPRALEILQFMDEELGKRRFAPATTIRLPTSRRWWRSISPGWPGFSVPRASRTWRAGTRRSRRGRAPRPERRLLAAWSQPVP